MKTGFVYIWRDKKHNRFYIGCHWGSENDGYVCSSNWMRDSYKRRPSDFRRKILSRQVDSRVHLLEEEFKWLSMIKEEEIGKRYYNLNKKHFGHWTISEQKRLTIGQKISASPLRNQRISESQRGKKLSESTKQKLREANLGKKQSAESSEKKRQANLTRDYGDDFKITMKRVALTRSNENLFGGNHATNGMLGKMHSEETKNRMSLQAKQQVMCPHCNKEGGASAMRRWHFNNCSRAKLNTTSEHHTLGVLHEFQYQ